MKIFTALFFVAVLPAAAQKVEVPHKLDFAGITLIIRDDARREIQEDVDALTRSPRHYQIKVERARTYFPIIEKIFREEGLPDDFKYLVLQESALIADAVSTSNAVGFWQFKDFTAAEMGLRVDRHIDERMNIVSSTRAAARYIIKNNQYFDNWLYALQSYQMGAGGVMKSVKDTQANATRMEITAKTYWYVKKFLAHMIAYEGAGNGSPEKAVVVFENRGRNTLERLAKETMVDLEELEALNKWTKSGDIPDDRTYVVLLPVEGVSRTAVPSDAVASVADEQSRVTPQPATARARTKINGVVTVRAIDGDNVRSLAARMDIEVPKFLKWNDLEKGAEIIPGQIYYLGRKRLKGSEDFHKVSEGQTLWMISQQYGLKLKRLKRYNRIKDDIDPPAGTMLYLASRRPKGDAVIAEVDNAVEVDDTRTFNWAVTTERATAEVVAAVPAPVETALPAEKTADEPAVNVEESREILQRNKTAITPEDAAEETPRAIPPNKRHTVLAGETLYAIARMYETTVMDLVALNELNLQDGIRPGQVLRVAPDVLVEADEAWEEGGVIFHEVRPSDTLYGVARQYDVTIKQIMEWNDKSDFTLAVGEKLKILRGQ